jgi:hypothetical protein
MPSETVAEENRTAGVVPAAPWRVSAVTALPNYCLSVTFVDGTRGLVKMAALVQSAEEGIFVELRNPALFEQARVDMGVITWPNGADLDPDWAHDEIQRCGELILA